MDQEFSFSEFNLTAAQELCEKALSILKDNGEDAYVIGRIIKADRKIILK